MKRAILILICIALLLAGCDAGQPAGTQQSAAEPSTELSGTAEPPRTETTAPAPTATEAPATEPSAPGYQAQGTPTAGGVLVYTDPSAYRPWGGFEAKYTRLREGPLTEFEPSADYGAVYPYLATQLFAADPDGYTNSRGGRYGLVDAGGRILTDGIYSGIEALPRYEEGEEALTFLPFWLTWSTDESRRVTESYDGESWSYVDEEYRYGLVSMDGSFALPMEYERIEACGDGFCCTRDWESSDFEVYDSRGRLCFTGAELRGGRSDTQVQLLSGDGEFYLVRFDVENDEELSAAFWFCDRTGKRVLGPYEHAGAFSEGLACVSVAQDQYGYIDAEGAWVIEPRFIESGSFRQGRAVHLVGERAPAGGYTEDSRFCVIDREGRELFSTEPGVWDLLRVPCGFWAYGTGPDRLYDLDGNLLLETSFGRCLDENTLWEWNETGSRVLRLNGPALELDELDFLSSGTVPVDGKAVQGYVGEGRFRGQSGELVISKDLSAVYFIGSHGTPTPYAYQSVFSTRNVCTNEDWQLVWNGEAWEAASETGELHSIPLRVNRLEIYGDRVMAVTEHACVLTDLDGKLIFSLPLDAGD